LIDTAQLAANWATVLGRVDEACRAVKRNPADVTVLPVSKTFGADVIRAAMSMGLRRFGENKVQEIKEKVEALGDDTIEWVVIGHLQTNKAKDVARLASEVQSLDRVELADALHRRLESIGRRLNVLVQVKTAKEESKYGLPSADLPVFLEQLRAFPTLRVRGLMTMATLSEDPEEVRACFRQLRELRDQCEAKGYVLPRLSMGMSGDFPLAIAEGATEVRVGTAIFGKRSLR
jgi:pyridoxal phosphate enzyme (YggS family)